MNKYYNIENNHKSQLENIWRDTTFKNFKVISRGYLSHSQILKNSLMFIGINPSYLGQQLNYNFYELKQKDNEYKKYFRVFENISENVGLSWTHLDLLYFRETSQKYIDALLKSTNGRNFIKKQLDISKHIIEHSKPKIIVVVNTKARDFLGYKNKHWIDFEFLFDDEIGTYRINNKSSNLYNVPVFFSGMLSGSRALDIGSRERLVWHIKQILD